MRKGINGEKLKRARKKAGLKQYELGAKAGVHPSLISFAENDRFRFDEDQLRKIAEALGVTEKDLT